MGIAEAVCINREREREEQVKLPCFLSRPLGDAVAKQNQVERRQGDHQGKGQGWDALGRIQRRFVLSSRPFSKATEMIGDVVKSVSPANNVKLLSLYL